MSKNSSEILAANKVTDSLALTDGMLSPDIKQRDKTPTWDGYVYIYHNGEEKKSEMIGSVAVQVKGKRVIKNKNGFPLEFSHSAEVADLRNYLYNGGAIYFVVLIDKNNLEDRQIYYNALAPVKLRQYNLQNISSATVSISLKQFPSERDKKIGVFMNFNKDSKAQTSFAQEGTMSIDDISSPQVEEVSISVITDTMPKNEMDILGLLSDNDTYAYAKLKGSQAKIPIDFLPSNLFFERNDNSTVEVEGKVYFDSISYISKKNEVILRIGDCLSFSLNNKTKKVNVDFTPNNMLRPTTEGLDFIIAALKAKQFKMGNIDIPLAVSEKDLALFNLKERESYLLYCKRIVELLDVLHIDSDIDLSQVTQSNNKNLHILQTALLDGKSVRNLVVKDNCLIDVNINGTIIRTIVEKNGDEFIIKDFFNSNKGAYRTYDDGSIAMSSIYSVLKVDEFNKLSNINFNNILQSYKEISDKQYFSYETANIDLLKMLLAYDESNNLKLLKAIQELAKWLKDESNEIPEDIKLVNWLQSIKRERELTSDEKRQLQLLLDDSVSCGIKTAINLLLDNQIAADIHFEKMSQEDRDTFIRFPIFHFWKNNTIE